MRTHIKKAFTLLELIIVLVVLGILAAIVIPQFTQVTERAENSAAARSAEAFDREVRNLAGFDAHKASPDGDARHVTYLGDAVTDVDGVTVQGIAGGPLDTDGRVFIIEGPDPDCDEGETIAVVAYGDTDDNVNTAETTPESHRAGEPALIGTYLCQAGDGTVSDYDTFTYDQT